MRRIKSKLPPNIYLKLYSTGSAPGKYYGTTKTHKMSPTETINKLALKQIVGNIAFATYHQLK